ncbi:hypothetical protein WMY93_004919 [Mugilogobius chulae]|uniref:Uncharacterized protein n=1 Tax=Mugilogobius chulae TaxID=88201 RepID=A0AAW0PTJ9_9GOBI
MAGSRDCGWGLCLGDPCSRCRTPPPVDRDVSSRRTDEMRGGRVGSGDLRQDVEASGLDSDWTQVTDFQVQVQSQVTDFQVQVQSQVTDFQVQVQSQETDFQVQVQSQETDFQVQPQGTQRSVKDSPGVSELHCLLGHTPAMAFLLKMVPLLLLLLPLSSEASIKSKPDLYLKTLVDGVDLASKNIRRMDEKSLKVPKVTSVKLAFELLAMFNLEEKKNMTQELQKNIISCKRKIENVQSQETDFQVQVQSQVTDFQVQVQSQETDFQVQVQSQETDFQVQVQSLETDFQVQVQSQVTDFQVQVQSQETDFQVQVQSQETDFQVQVQSQETDFQVQVQSLETDFQVQVQSQVTDFQVQVQSQETDFQVQVQSQETDFQV